MSEQRRRSYFSAKVMSAAVLAGALFLSAVPQIHADDDHGKCQRRIEKAESRLDEAVRHHGERSPEAESRRRDLNVERERCWKEYHGYWSGVDHRWHSERDWDHDDREHHDEH